VYVQSDIGRIPLDFVAQPRISLDAAHGEDSGIFLLYDDSCCLQENFSLFQRPRQSHSEVRHLPEMRHLTNDISLFCHRDPVFEKLNLSKYGK
jgi:hypothetical protein